MHRLVIVAAAEHRLLRGGRTGWATAFAVAVSAAVLVAVGGGSGQARSPLRVAAFAGSYSPDGRHIVLRIDRHDHGALAVVDAGGTHLRQLTVRSAAKPRFIDWGPGALRR